MLISSKDLYLNCSIPTTVCARSGIYSDLCTRQESSTSRYHSSDNV